MRPYTPLELAGRDIYVREGCYCHSQMIRSLRDEVERYGHYSLAAEACTTILFNGGQSAPVPTLPGSAANIPTSGAAHMTDPRAVVPESVMPGYPFLASASSTTGTSPTARGAPERGVPYTDEMIEDAKADLERQVDPEAAGIKTSSRAIRRPRCAVRRRPGLCVRARRGDRLSANAGHIGRFRDLRRRRA